MQYDTHEYLLQVIHECMFKINKLESTLCNDCGHTANNDGVCVCVCLFPSTVEASPDWTKQ